MDQIITAALSEFLVLSRMNWEGRNPVEAAIRARALQEISGLDTEELTRMALDVRQQERMRRG